MTGYLAKVVEQFPTEDSVEVVFINNSPIKYRARVGKSRANPLYGKSGGLPDIGEIGIVLKLENYGEEFFWVCSLVDPLENICADTSGNEDGRTLEHHESDVYHQITKTGDFEFSHPSGTFLKIGSNTTLNDRFRYVRKAGKINLKEKVPYLRRQAPPVPLTLSHTWLNGAISSTPYPLDKRKLAYSGDIKKTSIIMDAAGQVQIDHQAADNAHLKLTMDKDGNLTIDCPHKVTVNSVDQIQVNAELVDIHATTSTVNATNASVTATASLALAGQSLTINNTGNGALTMTNSGGGGMNINTGAGAVALVSGGSLSVTSTGNASIQSTGSMAIVSTGDMAITAPNVAVTT